MKKVLLSICIVVMIFSVTGCGKVAKLENGQDAVVTLEGYDSISANNLYDEIKEKYAISVLIDMIDEKILNEKYPQDEEEKDQIEAQISSWLKTYGSEAVLLQQTQSAFGVSTMEDLRSYLSLQYKRSKAVEDYAKSWVKYPTSPPLSLLPSSEFSFAKVAKSAPLFNCSIKFLAFSNASCSALFFSSSVIELFVTGLIKI